MENQSTFTKAGTAGGTLLVLLMNIFSATDILHTIILSAIGAAVSCAVSLLFKMILKRIRKRADT